MSCDVITKPPFHLSMWFGSMWTPHCGLQGCRNFPEIDACFSILADSKIWMKSRKLFMSKPISLGSTQRKFPPLTPYFDATVHIVQSISISARQHKDRCPHTSVCRGLQYHIGKYLRNMFTPSLFGQR